MKKEDVNPYVRFFNKVTGKPVYNKMVCAYDHRLFYIMKGNVIFEFENRRQLLSVGDLITIQPGIAYKLHFEKGQDTEYFIINFDFVFDPLYRASRAPVEKKAFAQNRIFSKECVAPFTGIFVLQNCRNIEPALEEMYKSNLTDCTEGALLGSALLKTVLTKIMIKNKAESNQTESAKMVQNVKDYIDKNSDQKLTNISVASYFGYHPYYLNSVFSNSENMTLHNYINQARIRLAKEKLSLTKNPIFVISQEMGFLDCSYFSAFFKKATGMTPKAYRDLCK